jgi:maleate isomerase
MADTTRAGWAVQDVVLRDAPALCFGLLALANDGTIESDAHAFLGAEDIRIYTTRVYTPRQNNLATFAALEGRLASAAAMFPEDRLDVIGFGCTSGAMALGPDRIRAAFAARPGVPVTDPVSAALRAFQALGCRRIALLTPYIPEVNALVGSFLTTQGLELAATGYFPLTDDDARNRVTAGSIEHAATRLTEDPAIEALFVSCTALRGATMVEQLEARIGRPVVMSNQALCWDALRLAGDRRLVANGGRLFSH